jgi:hypothetical protein
MNRLHLPSFDVGVDTSIGQADYHRPLCCYGWIQVHELLVCEWRVANPPRRNLGARTRCCEVLVMDSIILHPMRDPMRPMVPLAVSTRVFQTALHS